MKRLWIVLALIAVAIGIWFLLSGNGRDATPAVASVPTPEPKPTEPEAAVQLRPGEQHVGPLPTAQLPANIPPLPGPGQKPEELPPGERPIKRGMDMLSIDLDDLELSRKQVSQRMSALDTIILQNPGDQNLVHEREEEKKRLLWLDDRISGVKSGKQY
jgi:hypothetical protein